MLKATMYNNAMFYHLVLRLALEAFRTEPLSRLRLLLH